MENILVLDSYNDKQCKLEWSFAGGGPIFKPDDLMMFEFTLYDIKITNRSMDYGLFGRFLSIVISCFVATVRINALKRYRILRSASKFIE